MWTVGERVQDSMSYVKKRCTHSFHLLYVALRHGVTVDGHLLTVAHFPLSTDVPAPRHVISSHAPLPCDTHMPFLAVFISPITKLTVTSMAFHMQTAETLPRSSMDRQWELSFALQEQIFPQTPPLLQNARSGTVAQYHPLPIKAEV